MLLGWHTRYQIVLKKQLNIRSQERNYAAKVILFFYTHNKKNKLTFFLTFLLTPKIIYIQFKIMVQK